MRQLRWMTACAVAVLASAGCRTIEPAVDALGLQGPPRTPVPICFRRVAIVSFANHTAYAQPAEQFTASLREKLDDWTTSTDVVVIPADSVPGLSDPLMSGTLPLEVLVDVRRRHMADAIIIGAVDGFNPYWMPSVNVSLKVLDTATAACPFELSQTWDANERPVREAIETYYRRNVGRDDCRFGPNLFIVSPSYFLRFVADQVAESLTAGL
jgi:hypothetical protein